MSWFWLIFISTNLFSIINLFDKFICGQRIKNTYVFAVSIYLLGFIFLIPLSFFVDWSGLFGWPFFWALASGPIFFFMWILWWRGLALGEASRAAAIFNTAPIFNALVAVSFLGEKLTFFKWVAIAFIVVGAIFCSWENKAKGRLNPAYLLVVLAAIFNALGNVTSKFAMTQIGALTLYPLSFFSSLPLYFFLIRKKEVFFGIKEVFSDKKAVVLLFGRGLIAFNAICLYYLALSRGPVSLVSAVYGIGPLLVFVYSTLISLFRPKFIKEEISRQALLTKGLAIVLIVSGVIIINQ